MQYDNRPKNHMTICLNDSIFKNNQKNTTLEQQYHHGQQTYTQKYYLLMKPSPISCSTKILLQQYINGQYYGRVNQKKQPSGSGIVIDDQFNFFLSNWDDKFRMNGLTFTKLLNGTMIYGTWIEGRMNGWNVIKIGEVEIFMNMKSQGIIDSPVLVVNHQRKVAYLLQLNVKNVNGQNQNSKIQIINRKILKFQTQKEKNYDPTNPRDIFSESIDLKIPHYLFAPNDFMTHFGENVQDVDLREVQSGAEKLVFVSVKDIKVNANKQLSVNKKNYFIPFPKLISTNPSLVHKNNKKLGLLYNLKTTKTTSIGQFNSNDQLNGLGINTSAKTNQTLFGLFKSNMLITQLQSFEHFTTKILKTRPMKKQLTQNHMKSLNFINDYLYFSEIDDVVVLMRKITHFIEEFQVEYSKRYGSQMESFAQSDHEYGEGKYDEQTRSKGKQNYLGQMSDQQSDDANIFVKKIISKQKEHFPPLRPYGKIVKSRSPLRQLQSLSRSHSKSPSDIQTFRKPIPSFNIIRQKSQHKNLIISTNSSLYNHRCNQQTMKNRNQNENSRHSQVRNPSYFYAHNRKKEGDENIQTIRLRDEYFPIQRSSRRSGGREQNLEFKPYSRHLRNNYFQMQR